MSIDDLMRALQDKQQGQSADSIDSMSESQIVHTLRDVIGKMFEEEPQFRAGDILIHKWPGHRDTKGGAAPVVYVGKFDTEVELVLHDSSDMFDNTMTKKPDIIIGTLRDNGEGQASFVMYPSCSFEWKKHPDYTKEDLM